MRGVDGPVIKFKNPRSDGYNKIYEVETNSKTVKEFANEIKDEIEVRLGDWEIIVRRNGKYIGDIYTLIDTYSGVMISSLEDDQTFLSHTIKSATMSENIIDGFRIYEIEVE